jgi:protein TonB
MKKNIISLIIAITLHLLILELSSFLMGDKPNAFFEYHSIIPVQFGNGANGVRMNAPKAPMKKTTTEISMPDKKLTPESIGPLGSSENSSGADQGSVVENSFESTILSYQGPAYPRLAQVRGLEGLVRIKIQVSNEGLPQTTTILKSSGHKVLDQAALDVVPSWKFQARGAAYSVEKNIVFKLKN